MRLKSLLKKHSIGFNSICEAFDIMKIEFDLNINSRLDEDDIIFLEQLIQSKEFENYCIYRQEYNLSVKNLSKFNQSKIDELIEKNNQSKYEQNRIFVILKSNSLVSSYYLKLKASPISKVQFSNENLSLLIEIYKSLKFKTDKEIFDLLTKNVETKKYSLQRKLSLEKPDFEDMIMRSLARGDSEKFGF